MAEIPDEVLLALLQQTSDPRAIKVRGRPSLTRMGLGVVTGGLSLPFLGVRKGPHIKAWPTRGRKW